MTVNVYYLQANTLPAELDTIETSGIVIHKQNGQAVTLSVRTAVTPEQQSTGLMFVQSLDGYDGMLFDFQESQYIYMWMQNTYIYLDMLFFDSNNELVYIHENAIPHDLTLIGPHLPIRYVLEIAGGRAKDLGITIGDSLEALEELVQTEQTEGECYGLPLISRKMGEVMSVTISLFFLRQFIIGADTT